MLLNKYLFMLSVHMIVPDGEGSGSGSGTGTEGEGSAKGADTGDTDDDAGDDDDDDEDDTDPVSLRAKIKAQKERADAADAKAARRIKEIKRLKAEREGQSKPKTDQGGKPAAKEGTVPKDGGTPEADAKVAEAEKKAADAEARALTSSRKGDLGYQLSALGIGKADARDIIDLALLNLDDIDFDEEDGHTLDIDAFVARRPKYAVLLKPGKATKKLADAKAGEGESKKAGVQSFPKFKFKSGSEVILTQEAISKMTQTQYNEAAPEIRQLIREGKIKG